MMNPTIVICGAGGIGRAAALILACNPAMNPQIYIGDINAHSLGGAVTWITEGMSRNISVKTFIMPMNDTNDEMNILFEEADVILDCLPGSQAPRIAALAHEYGAHYVNLTEYVNETNKIIELAKDSEQGFLLQTGIAPGYVNVLACALHDEFRIRYGVDELKSMRMRVGALSQSANAPSFYAYTWSMIGVATEYVKDAMVIQNGKRQRIPSLSGRQEIFVNGERLIEDYTSGGAANLPSHFEGKVHNLDYKTLRYPGHFQWVQQCIDQLGEPENLAGALDEMMRKEVPSVENDRIVMYAMVSGFDKHGILRMIDKAYDIAPTCVGSKMLRAIQATTASALCESAYYLLKNQPQGVVLQTDLDPEVFLNGPYVSEVYGKIDFG